MLTKKESLEISKKKIIEKFINVNNKFKFNRLKEFDIDTPVKELNSLNAEYTYGNSEIYGKWALLVDNENEGFFFIIGAYKSNLTDRYESFTEIYTTSKYEFIKKRFNKYLDTNQLRNLQSLVFDNYIHIKKTEINSRTIYMNLLRRYVFSSDIIIFDSKITTPRKAEMIILILSLKNNNIITSFQEIENIVPEEYIKSRLDILKNKYPNVKLEELKENIVFLCEITNVTLSAVEKHIKYFSKNNISIESLCSFLYYYSLNYIKALENPE